MALKQDFFNARWYSESMADFKSIAEMMESCARDAVHLAQERFGFSLDYSEESIESLETILASVSGSLRDRKNSSEKEAIEQEVKLWGSYLGEVVRRRWDGAWDLVRYPGGVAAVPTLLVAGSQLYPLVKVYRRLTLGDAENIWNFYQKIRQKLCPVYPADGSA
jgi:hypothetical protein